MIYAGRIATRNGYFVSGPAPQAPVRLWFHGEGVGAVRPSVAAFALLMEAQLQRHEDRPGWEGDRVKDLVNHLREERIEFDRARQVARSIAEISAEGADEANMVLMIVQNLGGLNAFLAHLLGGTL